MIYVLSLIVTVLAGLTLAVIIEAVFILAGFGLLPGWWRPHEILRGDGHG